MSFIERMNVRVYNGFPCYAVIDQVVTPELAEAMMLLVDNRGGKSSYGGNPNTIEYRLESHVGSHLITAGKVDDREELLIGAEIQKAVTPLIPKIIEVFKNTALENISGHRGFWIMRYGEGGEFTEHVDWSLDDDPNSTPAVATMCIRLNDDYKGGETLIDGHNVDVPVCGAYIWDGWTYHTACEVTLSLIHISEPTRPY